MDGVLLFPFRTGSKPEMLYEEVCMLLFLPMSRTVFVTPVMYVFFFPFLKCLKHTDHIALIIELLGKVPRKLIVAGKYSKEFFTKKGKISVFIPRHSGAKSALKLRGKYSWVHVPSTYKRMVLL